MPGVSPTAAVRALLSAAARGRLLTAVGSPPSCCQETCLGGTDQPQGCISHLGATPREKRPPPCSIPFTEGGGGGSGWLQGAQMWPCPVLGHSLVTTHGRSGSGLPAWEWSPGLVAKRRCCSCCHGSFFPGGVAGMGSGAVPAHSLLFHNCSLAHVCTQGRTEGCMGELPSASPSGRWIWEPGWTCSCWV